MPRSHVGNSRIYRIGARRGKPDFAHKLISHVSATNLSKVPIVAMVTHTIIGNSLGSLIGENHQLDAFFAHDLEIAPGQTSTHQHDDNGEFSTPVSKGAVKITPAC